MAVHQDGNSQIDAIGSSGQRSTAALQYAVLRAKILGGEFPPGTRLYETVLSADLGVSRTPVREALGQLEHEGLVERAARGYRIRVSTPQEILHIYEVRIALEAAAAAAAARRRTEDDLARLRSVHQHEVPAGSGQASASDKSNASFHEVVWEASHNRALVDRLENVDTQIRLLDRAPVTARANLDRTRAEHQRILDAIARQDENAASRHMTKHLTRTRDVRLQAFADEVR